MTTAGQVAAQGLERMLLAQCEVMAARGRARVTRCHPAVQVVRALKGGRVEGFVTGIMLDFEGVLSPSGRCVLLEAKTSHAGTSWPLCDLGDEQALRMASWASCGALALLYVQRWDGLSRAGDYLLPVDGAGRIAGLVTHPALLVLSNERKSIRWEDMEPWRVAAGESWLDAAKRLGGA